MQLLAAAASSSSSGWQQQQLACMQLSRLGQLLLASLQEGIAQLRAGDWHPALQGIYEHIDTTNTLTATYSS